MQKTQFTNQHFWALLLFIVLTAVSVAIPRDLDYFWHLRNGQWMVEHGEIIRIDPFSYTMFGEPRIAYDWLADIGMYLFWTVADHKGFALLVAGLCTVIFISTYYTLKGHIYVRFLVIMPLLFLMIHPSLTPRPQLISFIFFTWTIFLTYRYKRGMDKKWLLLMPLMFIAWANLHGGWSVAAIFMIVVTVGEVFNNLLRSKAPYIMSWERLKWYFGACALSAGALLITPFGLDLVLFPIEAFFSLSTWNSEISEWYPTQLNDLRGWMLIIFTVLYAICVLVPAYRKKQLDWSHLLLGLVMGYMAYRYRRSVIFFGLMGAPLLIEQLTIWLRTTKWGERTYHPHPVAKTPAGLAIKQSLFILMALFVGAYAVWSLSPEEVEKDLRVLLPVDAVNTLKEQQLPKQLFSHYNWGGYLLWEAPEYPVFIDGRTDLYRDFYFEWARILRGEDWESAFEEWDIHSVLLYPEDHLALILSTLTEWETVYRDDKSVLYTRARGGSN
jgi:hypothetical protein